MNGLYNISRPLENAQVRHQHEYKKIKDEREIFDSFPMPSWDSLNGFEVFVLTKDVDVNVMYNGLIYSYKFRCGFVHDKASVPSLLNSVLRNDDKDLIVPALVHDFNFGTNAIPFKDANNMFKDMIVQSGYERIAFNNDSRSKRIGVRWKARIAYLGVASPIGKSRYYGKEWKRDYMDDFAKLTIINPSEIGAACE